MARIAVAGVAFSLTAMTWVENFFPKAENVRPVAHMVPAAGRNLGSHFKVNEGGHNNWLVTSFEWTKGGRSPSSIGSFPFGKTNMLKL